METSHIVLIFTIILFIYFYLKNKKKDENSSTDNTDNVSKDNVSKDNVSKDNVSKDNVSKDNVSKDNVSTNKEVPDNTYTVKQTMTKNDLSEKYEIPFLKQITTSSDYLSSVKESISNMVNPKTGIFILKDEISENIDIDIPSIKTIIYDKYGEKLGDLIIKSYSNQEIENLLYE